MIVYACILKCPKDSCFLTISDYWTVRENS